MIISYIILSKYQKVLMMKIAYILKEFTIKPDRKTNQNLHCVEAEAEDVKLGVDL